MRVADLVGLATGAIIAHRLRSFLTTLGIAVGIGAVVLLTSIGEGVHRFVLSEFTQFGTNLMAITPGKTETFGMSGAIVSNVRPLSLGDAEALKRLDRVLAVVPVVQGNARAESRNRDRRTMVLGVGSEVPRVWQMQVRSGRFLPAGDLRRGRAVAVLGNTLRQELFGHANPLGQPIRIGGERFRIIGVMEPKGQFLGFDLDDTVYIPASKALQLFNRESLMEIDLLYRPGTRAAEITAAVERLMLARHGHPDFTVVTQQQMLDVLGSVLNVLTVAVGALGGISLLVGGVGIITIMTIAVNERVSEIGLLRALGATRKLIMVLFLGEAIALAAIGGLAGLVVGVGLAQALRLLLPALPVHTPWTYAVLAELLAMVVGLIAGVLPARRAASMEPVEALREE